MADYSEDTPYECSRYAYNPAGERVAYVSAADHAEAQRYGSQGWKTMRITQPFPDYDPTDAPTHAFSLETMVVHPMLWRHRRYSDAWAIQLESDEDVARYLAWHPKLALPAVYTPKGGGSVST